MYTFDDGPQCLVRSSLSRDIRVIYNEDQTPLGIIDLQTCLQNVTNSSPEILSSLNNYDYAVYTTDYTEPGSPLVGHGMLSWLALEKHDDSELNTPINNSANNSKLIVGRICTNILGLFSGGSKETLEVNLRLKPVTSCTQAQYLRSIKLYKELASFLPPNFDHPAWASFISQNSNLTRFVKKEITDIVETPKSHLHQLQQDDTDDLFNVKTSENQRYTSCRQKSASPSAYPSSETMFDDNFPKPSNTSFNFSNNSNRYIASSSPPPLSSSVMSNLDSDAITSYSSPQQPPYDYNSTSVEKPGKQKWQDGPTSPVSMSSPSILSDSNRPIKMAKRSLSITSANAKPLRMVDSADNVNFRVVARGSKYRPKDRITKSFYEPSSLGSTTADMGSMLFCRNCGTVDPSTTWRRVKVTPNDGLGDEREHVLCNPCGLWFNAKRTMRPAHLWSKDTSSNEPSSNGGGGFGLSSPNDEMTPVPAIVNGNPANTLSATIANSAASASNVTNATTATTTTTTTSKPKEKLVRRRRGLGNKPHEDYVGPSIAELLAQNTRSKPSNYSASSITPSSSNGSSTVTAPPKKPESDASKDTDVSENKKKDSSDNKDDDNNDNNNTTSKDEKEGTDEAIQHDSNLSSSVSTGNTPIDDGPERKKPAIPQNVIAVKGKPNQSTKVTKKTKEKKLSKRAKKALLLHQTEPVFIAPAPPAVPVLLQELPRPQDDTGAKKTGPTSPKPTHRLSAFNAINLESSSTTVKKSGFTVMNKRPPASNTALTPSSGITEEKESISPKDTSNPPLSNKELTVEEAPKDTPVITEEQLQSFLMTPQKMRRGDFQSGGSQVGTLDDFGFFDPSAFSGSPSRWINKLLSPTKYSPGFGADAPDDAFRDIMCSPSKIKGDMFEVLNHDFGLDTTVPTAFAKMMNHQTASIDKAHSDINSSNKGSKTKSPSSKSVSSCEQSSDLPVCETSSSSEDGTNGSVGRMLGKSINIASSPPIHVYTRDDSSHTSDAPMDVWSDSPTTNNEDTSNEDVGTVKITSPELTKE